MTDMSQFIAPKSDQLNADDLIAGPRTITITDVKADPGNAEQPILVRFEGDNGKPFKPCKSMRRVMVAVWGADSRAYIGRSMTLFRDPKVTWGGMEVGGIRISHMSDIDRPVTMALTATQRARKPYTVAPLASAPKPSPEALTAARDAAANGSDAFRAWWRETDDASRAAAKSIIGELQAIASEADAADPLSDPAPTEAEREAAMREAEQQARDLLAAQDGEGEG